MNYPCSKFGDVLLSRFGFILRTNTQTRTHRESHTHAAKRFTHATVGGVSNYELKQLHTNCKLFVSLPHNCQFKMCIVKTV